MPCWELFELEAPEYKASVLPPSVTARVAIEQASNVGWARYAGTSGAIIAMETFGASAPLKELQEKFGFTPEKIVSAAKEQIARGRSSTSNV
jgi:transketolase